MINIINAKREFENYSKNYDMNNEGMKYKYEHSIRVMEYSKEIAKSLNLTDEQIELAALIGLLHDISRFEQLKQYSTFDDSKSFDHGDYAIEILFKDNYIRKYIDSNEYDEIIKKSIMYHNKFEIGVCDTEEELLFSKLIRDADKIDIFYYFIDKEIKGFRDEIITPEVYDSFFEMKNLNFKDMKTSFDKKLLQFSMVFDLNFKYSFDIIKEKNYINILIDKYNGLLKNNDTVQKLNNIKDFMNKYLDSK